MLLLLAQDLERTLIELLPWLVPVLIAIVAGIGRLMSELLERRVEKMRRFEEEGGGTKRPSIPRSSQRDEIPTAGDRPSGDASSGDEPAKPRRTILEEIRRYMEMMEERSLGDDRPGTGGDRRPEPRPETRRPTGPASRPAESPQRAESRTPTGSQPSRDPRTKPSLAPQSRPKSRPRSYSEFEGEVPAGASEGSEAAASPWAEARLRGSRLPAEMRQISLDDDPFAAFWGKKQVGRHSFRPKLDRRGARQAFVLAALLGRPRGDRAHEEDPLGPFTG